MGKTQTALAFAHIHKNDYDSVLWLTGIRFLDSNKAFELAVPLIGAGLLQGPCSINMNQQR